MRWPLYATIGFLITCFVLGGASRADVVQHALMRPIAIALALGVVCFAPRIDWRAIRWPAGLLIALALLMIVQLIPLPYSWWTALPGRESARMTMELIGAEGTAHAISLTPDRTLNSLFALAIPAASLISMASLGARERRLVLIWLVGAVMINMLLGFLQLVQGSFYLYDITNMGSAVGFFANRNHNAALIAAALPLLGCLATWPLRKHGARPVLWLFAAGLSVLAMLAILAIGSRWGLVIAAMGLAWGGVVIWRDLREVMSRQPKWMRVASLSVPAVVAVGFTALGARDESLRRLSELTLEADTRMQTLPVTSAMASDMLPFGSGFGSFEAMYRAAEPRELLDHQYLNHVHNDYVELIIEAGVAGLALLAVAISWYLVVLVRSFREQAFAEGIDRRIAQAAGGVILLAALASITDYPVRTPIWMMVLAMSAVWLVGISSRIDSKTDGSSALEHASPPLAEPERLTPTRLKV